MRAFFLLACVYAVAYGQLLSQDSVNVNQKDDFTVEEAADGIENTDFSSLREDSDVGVASQDNVASVQETSDIGVASQDAGLRESSDLSEVNNGASLTETGDVSQLNDESEVSKVRPNSDVEDSKSEGSYQSAPDQYEAQSAPRPLSSKTCIEKNDRYAVPGSCDKYIECLNGTAEEKVCPDGLRYNPNVKFNVYPCQYPIDVPCLARAALQPAQPTADCPHQFGYFKTGDTRNCGTFKNCVNGVGYDFNCPEGLAFSSETYRCEWPDQVPDCDAEAFLGFRCPEIPISKELGPPAGFRFYRSQEDCQKYFLCIDGKPRRLACGGYTAFDELSEACVAADEVSACPLELRNGAERSRKAESERLIAQNAFENFRKTPEDATTFSPYNKKSRSEKLQEPESYTEESQVQDIENNDEIEQPVPEI